jgi:hypothetical protein
MSKNRKERLIDLAEDILADALLELASRDDMAGLTLSGDTRSCDRY